MAAQQFFIGTLDDLFPGIRLIEQRLPLKYVLMGMREDSRVIEYDRAEALPNPGCPQTGDSLFDPRYLVVGKSVKIRPRRVSQRRGGDKYVIDQRPYAESVVAQFGGRFAPNVFVVGEIDTMHKDRESASFYRDFCRGLTRGFVNVKGWNLGPEAFRLWRAGWRVVTSASQAEAYDLQDGV